MHFCLHMKPSKRCTTCSRLLAPHIVNRYSAKTFYLINSSRSIHTKFAAEQPPAPRVKNSIHSIRISNGFKRAPYETYPTHYI